ncbi:MAG: Holliday junction resolvase RuvX [Actinobacteria bacterium]|nr:MAG: Holliday junction resolvase RuvX [Actinomycetota bacterium]
MSFRRGVRLGVDVGSVRIGVARCDPDGILATPVGTVPRGDGDLQRLAELAREHEAVEIVVGLPVTLKGERGPAAEAATDFATSLSRLVDAPVRMVDERLSTAAAQRGLHAAGRDTRSSRSMIDQAAAVLIVQSAVDFEKSTGEPAGRMVRTA